MFCLKQFSEGKGRNDTANRFLKRDTDDLVALVDLLILLTKEITTNLVIMADLSNEKAFRLCLVTWPEQKQYEIFWMPSRMLG